MAARQIELYDTTLRDGTQGEDLALSVPDKLRIAKRLDAFGIDFIEGGWPGSNPKDEAFFKEAKKLRLKHSQLAAFGSTCKPTSKAEKDPNLAALIAAQTPVITIFGKTWDFHVRDALKISLPKNLELIRESVRYLKRHAGLVFFDAEHFFDGFKANREYALRSIQAALEAGADRLVLCETNGGTLPHEVAEIVTAVQQSLPKSKLGIHCHNDAEVGVANSLTALRAGAVQVHGTINGYGERCGNANLCSIIPALSLKMGLRSHADKHLGELSELSHFASEVANLPHPRNQPYVGESAFAHKGGIHVSAILKHSATYEHIDPKKVGNRQRVLISDLSGESNLLYKAKALGIPVRKGHPGLKKFLQEIKALENVGYAFEGAEASFEIRLREAVSKWPNFFEVAYFRATDHIDEHSQANSPTSEATVKIRVSGREQVVSGEGVGPVNALDKAMRKALEDFYPSLKSVSLKDYKVRVLSDGRGTAAMVRVLIEFSDAKDTWRTVGVSPNIIEASEEALADGLAYKLFRDGIKTIATSRYAS